MLYGTDEVAKRDSAETFAGTPGPTPALVGALQTVEVLAALLNRHPATRRGPLYLDLERRYFEEMSL
ncbi:MAG: hypothetical protein HQK58_07880 [Deltaproteobacteria bacterium]|nr:hypothetical protein [Deltaproteobacteria bacterium]